MKNNFRLIVILFCFTTVLVNGQTRKQALNKFLATSNLKHASIGISVKKISGENVLSHNSQQSLTPASTLKILTTASALELLGSDYKYKTTLGSSKDQANTLVIYGYGDPSLGSDKMEQNAEDFLADWQKVIVGKFGTTAKININLIDHYYGYDAVSRKWQREDIGNYFAPEVYGISVFDNTYKLYLNTLDRKALPKLLKSEPQMSNMRFVNTLSLNTTAKDNGYIIGEPMSDEKRLIGDIPAGKASFIIKGSIPNPALTLGGVLVDRLRGLGMTIDYIGTSMNDFYKHYAAANIPAFENDIFYTHLSPPLSALVREVNENSNNHYAEHILMSIGRNGNKNVYSSALDEAIKAEKAFWKSKGLDTDGLFIHDGSGLAPANAVNAEFLTDVLLYMYNKSENKTAFYNSLPIAAREGTVKYFLRRNKLTAKVRVKSGSIEGVQCYSGYYINGAEKYAFTILVNNFNGTHSDARTAIEKLLIAIL